MVHHGAALAKESGDAELQEAVVSGRFEHLSPRFAALCRYAVKLTLRPYAMVEDDVRPLRDAGLTARDVVDANQVVAYFNYVNRIVDGLGVELEDRWPPELRSPRRYHLRDLFD